MVTKKDLKGRMNEGKSSGRNSQLKKRLLYGGLAIAAIYTMRKIPVLKSLTWPIVATAASKYFRGLQGKMQTA
jgi:hypothetical protein